MITRQSSASISCLSFLMLSFFCSFVSAQGPANPAGDKAAQQLVRSTVDTEVAACRRSNSKLMFLSQKQTPQGSETKLNVETTETTAGMLIKKNNRPISDEQMRNEATRLERLQNNAADLRRKQRLQQQEDEHGLRIVQALPDAFLYDFDGTEPGTAKVGKPGDTLIRLKFHPNPSYAPPSHVEQILAGMHGNLLIDKDAHRFGWGILGHLDAGGAFLVDQAEVAPGDWELTHTRLDLTGKVMMVKSLVIKSEETDSEFRAVPSNTTFAQGVDLLKAEQARLQKKEESTRTAANKN
jgi:hypothetical protein